MQNGRHGAVVYLGFADTVVDSQLYQLRSCFLPLGKVGGRPSWLNPVAIPPSQELKCKVCSSPLCFLLQVYATSDNDEEHSFHRTLFIFICKDPKCNKPNEAANLTVFRCCLPRSNEFYPWSNPPDPYLLTAEECPPPPPGTPSLCKVCGCFASKRCAKCAETWYCSREHQVLDWQSGHRSKCGCPEGDIPSPANPINSFLFPELGMEMEREELPAALFDDLTDSEGEQEENEEEEKRRIDEYKKVMKGKRLEENNDAEDGEEAEERDKAFEKFNRLVSLYPEQILRYQRAGQPLVATERAPLLLDAIPPCPLCSSPRHFEMQLMPHLLSLIGVDCVGESIDWASLFIFTCSANCIIPESGYVREEIRKQDFA